MISGWLQQFDLRHDQGDPAAIDAAIKSGVQVGGTNLWVLIFAIMVASVGLNVNSTAVIIGAMLISPLMGPIIGIGYGVGVNDFALIKRALKSLAIFVAISLLTATLYFTVSPLSQAQSELLARTSPTLWDVLIAFFGGAAGIVALTRKEKSNVLPGVAIATALMPPLCTAGFGIATGNLDYFFGAFYLFFINSVFIAFATLLFVKLLKLPQHIELDESMLKRTRLMIGTAVIITLVPSAFLAYRLVQQELFSTTANRLVGELDHDKRFILLGKDISPKDHSVILTIGGDAPPAGLSHEVEARFADAGVPGTTVSIRYAGADKFDVSSLKQELQQDLYGNTLQQLEAKSAQVHVLEAENSQFRSAKPAREQLMREILAQYPEALHVTVAQGEQSTPDPAAASGTVADTAVVIVSLTVAKAVSRTDEGRLRGWLQARFPSQQIELLVTTEARDKHKHAVRHSKAR